MESNNRLDLVLSNKENLLNKLYKDKALFNNYTLALEYEYHVESPESTNKKSYNYDNEDGALLEDDSNVPSLTQIRNTVHILLQDLCVLNEKSLSFDDPDFSLNLDLQYYQRLLRDCVKLEKDYQNFEKNEKPFFTDIDLVSEINKNNHDDIIETPTCKLEMVDCTAMLDTYLTYNSQNEQNSSHDEKEETVMVHKLKMLNEIDDKIENNISKLNSEIESLKKIQSTLISKEVEAIKHNYQDQIITKYNNRLGFYNQHLSAIILNDFETPVDKLGFLSVSELFKFVANLTDIKIQSLKEQLDNEKANSANISDNLKMWLNFLKEIKEFQSKLLNILSKNNAKKSDESRNKLFEDLFDKHIGFIQRNIVDVCESENLAIVAYIQQELHYIKLTRLSL